MLSNAFLKSKKMKKRAVIFQELFDDIAQSEDLDQYALS